MSLFTANRNLSKELKRERRVGGDMLGSRGTEPKLACNWYIAVLIILLGAVSNLQSHAQASQMSSSCLPNYSFNDVSGSIPAADTAVMWPVVWQPGHTYSVTITGPTLTPTPGKCGAVGVYAREWPGYANPLGYGGADPYITLTNFTILDPTHMTYTASVSADAPIGNIFLQLSNPYAPNISFWAVMIDNPTPPSLPGAPDSSCPIPGDAVVKPDTWQAGQSYPIVITGSGFTTAAVAASNGCSETSIDVQVDAGMVTLSNVQVVSSTIITAQAKVSDDTPEEEATINIYGPTLGPQAIPRAPLMQRRSPNEQSSSAGIPDGLSLDGTAKATIHNNGKLYVINPYAKSLDGSGHINEADLIAIVSAPSGYEAVRARGLVTDGSATAIAVYQIGNNKQVKFTASGGLQFESWNPAFLGYPPSYGDCGGECSIRATPIRGNDGKYYAFALVHAFRQTSSTQHGYGYGNASIKASVETESGTSESDPTKLSVVPTPVILIHGLWSNASPLSEMRSALSMSYPWTLSAGNLPLVTAICYDATVPFDFDGMPPANLYVASNCEKASSTALSQAVAQIQKGLDDNKFVGGRIDVVAHSMGGLVTRHYTDTAPYKSSESRSRSRTEGLLRAVVTLDSPEAGSPLASALMMPAIADGTCALSSPDPSGKSTCDNGPLAGDPANTWIDLCRTSDVRFTLRQCLANSRVRKPIGPGAHPTENIAPCTTKGQPDLSCGAVASLATGSPNLKGAPRIDAIESDYTKWFAIVSDWKDEGGDSPSALRTLFNYLLGAIKLHGKLPDGVCPETQNGLLSSPLTLLCLMHNDPNNDVIVPTNSQADDTNGNVVEFFGDAHASISLAQALPQMWGKSDANILDGRADSCVMHLLLTSTTQGCLGGGAVSAVTGQRKSSEAQEESRFLPAPGESAEGAVNRSIYALQVGVRQVQISTLSRQVPLGNPIRLRLDISPGEVNTILYRELGEKGGIDTPDANAAKIVNDSGSHKTVEVVPLQLGEVEVAITVLYADNTTAEQSVLLNVVPSAIGLTAFAVDNGFHEVILTLDEDEADRIHWLVPTVTYEGVKSRIQLDDSAQLSFTVNQSAADPVIALDQKGQIRALRTGEATIIAEFAGAQDQIVVTVR